MLLFKRNLAGFIFVSLLLLPWIGWAGGAYSYRFPDPKMGFDPNANTVIGLPGAYVIKEKDTLLDVAREYDLGFNELEILYPDLDPWVPSRGMELLIPSQWVLPPTQKYGIVINIPEMRLYYFFKSIRMVRTHPIGIGDLGWFSPEGTFWVKEKRPKPTWYIPESLQEKYGMKQMPPGPDNPLGDYWLGLSISGYGIHGTNFPWAVGRLVTHGCIRLYPEDIAKLFPMVAVKTPVEMIYEPVKLGLQYGRLFVEVHPDIYGKIPDFLEYGLAKIRASGWEDRADRDLFLKALKEKKGLPVDITEE
jgi:L,D-transpeptidase ErfK/SrfK